MADIIHFQEYVYSKEEEKKRIKKISALSMRSKNIKSILHNIGSSIGCSLITKHFGEMNQIVGKDNIIDSDMQDVITDALESYDKEIHKQINELNSYVTQTVITC